MYKCIICACIYIYMSKFSLLRTHTNQYPVSCNMLFRNCISTDCNILCVYVVSLDILGIYGYRYVPKCSTSRTWHIYITKNKIWHNWYSPFPPPHPCFPCKQNYEKGLVSMGLKVLCRLQKIFFSVVHLVCVWSIFKISARVFFSIFFYIAMAAIRTDQFGFMLCVIWKKLYSYCSVLQCF